MVKINKRKKKLVKYELNYVYLYSIMTISLLLLGSFMGYKNKIIYGVAFFMFAVALGTLAQTICFTHVKEYYLFKYFKWK